MFDSEVACKQAHDKMQGAKFNELPLVVLFGKKQVAQKRKIEEEPQKKGTGEVTLVWYRVGINESLTITATLNYYNSLTSYKWMFKILCTL